PFQAPLNLDASCAINRNAAAPSATMVTNLAFFKGCLSFRWSVPELAPVTSFLKMVTSIVKVTTRMGLPQVWSGVASVLPIYSPSSPGDDSAIGLGGLLHPSPLSRNLLPFFLSHLRPKAASS